MLFAQAPPGRERNASHPVSVSPPVPLTGKAVAAGVAEAVNK